MGVYTGEFFDRYAQAHYRGNASAFAKDISEKYAVISASTTYRWMKGITEPQPDNEEYLLSVFTDEEKREYLEAKAADNAENGNIKFPITAKDYGISKEEIRKAAAHNRNLLPEVLFTDEDVMCFTTSGNILREYIVVNTENLWLMPEDAEGIMQTVNFLLGEKAICKMGGGIFAPGDYDYGFAADIFWNKVLLLDSHRECTQVTINAGKPLFNMDQHTVEKICSPLMGEQVGLTGYSEFPDFIYSIFGFMCDYRTDEDFQREKQGFFIDINGEYPRRVIAAKNKEREKHDRELYLKYSTNTEVTVRITLREAGAELADWYRDIQRLRPREDMQREDLHSEPGAGTEGERRRSHWIMPLGNA